VTIENQLQKGGGGMGKENKREMHISNE